MQRLRYIDALRGIAIILVIWHHSHPYFAGIPHYRLPVFFENTLNEGDKGVTLFFVMSAFTLCISMESKKKSELHSIRNYFLRRLFRIAPLYYCAIGTVLAVHINTPGPGSIAANMVLIHGLSPYWLNSTVPGGWSVGIEALFYLIFPLLFSLIRSTSAALNLTVLLMITAKIVTSLLFKNPLIPDQLSWGIFTYENIISQLPVFMMGICLFFITRKDGVPEAGLYRSCCLIALLVIIHLLGGNVLKDHYLFAVAFALLAYGLSRYPAPVLVNKFTVGIGKLSYSLYLVHLLVANLLVKYHLNHYFADAAAETVIRFVIVFSLSAGIAWFTYTFIELPCIHWGAQLIGKLEATEKLQSGNDFPDIS